MVSIKLPHPNAIRTVVQRCGRGRPWWMEYAAVLLIFALLLLGTYAFQNIWLLPQWHHTSSEGDRLGQWLQRWFSAFLVAEALLFPLAGLLLGAYSQPTALEAEELRGALLTDITALELTIGRFLARLRPLIILLVLSFLVSAFAENRFHVLQDGNVLSILQAYVALFVTALFFSALGYLFAGKNRPGRDALRATLIGLLLYVLLVGGIFFANPWLEYMENPTHTIELILTANPIVVVTSPIKFDLLRTQWVYEHTIAPDYPFLYPSWELQSLLFSLGATIAILLTSYRLQKALLT